MGDCMGGYMGDSMGGYMGGLMGDCIYIYVYTATDTTDRRSIYIDTKLTNVFIC